MKYSEVLSGRGAQMLERDSVGHHLDPGLDPRDSSPGLPKCDWESHEKHETSLVENGSALQAGKTMARMILSRNPMMTAFWSQDAIVTPS